jgi:hypothetical protein
VLLESVSCVASMPATANAASTGNHGGRAPPVHRQHGREQDDRRDGVRRGATPVSTLRLISDVPRNRGDGC